MTEVLYYIFIYPMQTILGAVFEWLHSLTSSYGISIILLSLLINFFLLKLTQISERKAKAIGILKNICDEKIKEFKRVFKGAELHAYTRTLFKQKHYHPIYNIFSLGGLALQIPFFLGVLFLLQDLEALKGARFFIIKDLSKPDTLAFGYALLPFIMSALSLVNVFMSSKEIGARLQGSVIALIFLVLLYVMPSGLVLYWTTSMAFSLVRTILNRIRRDSSLGMQCDRFSKLREARTPSALTSENLLKTAHSHTANARILDSAKTLDSINPESSNIIESITDSYQGFANSCSCRGIKSTYKSLLLLLKQIIHSIFTPHKDLDSKTYKTYRNISIFAFLNIFFLIFVFSPYAIYSSDVSQFDSTQTFQTLGGLFGFFLLFSFLGIYITSFFYKTRLLKLGVYGVSVILVIGIVYSFVLVGDYGAMNHFILEKLSFANPALRTQKYLGFFVAFFGSMVFVALTLRYLKMPFQILFITLFMLSLFYAFKILDSTEFNAPKDELAKNELHKPFENELFSYAKNHKNIIVIVLDMFSGSHTPYIFKQFPDLKDAFDGFVLFPNTISTSDSTIHSIATLIGGEYYATYNMNARADNLAETITKAFGETALAFVNGGYNVSYFMSISSQGASSIQQYTKNKIFTLDNISVFQEYYYTSVGLSDQINAVYKSIKDSEITLLASVGLFRFAPELYFRPRIYNQGLWLIKDNTLGSAFTSLSYISSLYAFTHIGNTNALKPTFKYLHSLATHMPYGTYFNQGKCSHFSSQTTWNSTLMFYPDSQDKDIYYQHYDTEACALSYITDFIKWLKSNNIYDNTQIFIVSDHGGNDGIGIPSNRADALLLFKDFGAKGKLKMDSRLMANYDITSIFCENLENGCPNVAQNILKHYPQNREVIHTIPASWMLNQHKSNQWILNKIYSIRGNPYEKQNWQDITKDFQK